MHRARPKDVVPATAELLRMLLEDAGSAKVTVVGNSAGAGLALAACQWLRDRGYRQPNRMVLISPAADASVSRPEQVAIAARDPIQDIPGNLEAGRLYAGELDIGHRFVSPLNGAFRALAPMTIFSGTRDLLFPDSVELADRATAAGVPVELHLLRDQPHNYALMPTPEGRRARAIILRAVAQGGGVIVVTKSAAAMGSGAVDARAERPCGPRGVSSFLVLVRRLGISSFAER
ncbi:MULTISPECIES: alpha/beta hydrolase fold domain-containing protein [unclassified Bradyrhizobium]|uniref:alpha/beta hydrolase fold domain-containing protein n=1 Tax=unclassified Bradyrhizobium TaxID=2631580 RepID=UPI00339A93B8